MLTSAAPWLTVSSGDVAIGRLGQKLKAREWGKHTGRRGRPNGGGAARQLSPERRRRGAARRPGSGARRGGVWEGERGRGGVQEHQQLTLVPVEATASREVAGNGEDGGGRRARAPVDWRDWGLPCLRRLVEENEGVEAELLGRSDERGEALSGGDGERPGLGFGRAAQRRGDGGRWRNGGSPLVGGGLYRRPGAAGAIQAAGSIDGAGRARQLPACVEEEGGFLKTPLDFWDFSGKRKTG
jgi:hypothetical protein